MRRCEVIKDWIYDDCHPFAEFNGRKFDSRSWRVSLTVDEKGRLCHQRLRRNLVENNGNWDCVGYRTIELFGYREDPMKVPAEVLEIRYDTIAGLYSDTLFTKTDEKGNCVKDYAAWATDGLSEKQIMFISRITELNIRDNEALTKAFRDPIDQRFLYDEVLAARLQNAGLR